MGTIVAIPGSISQSLRRLEAMFQRSLRLVGDGASWLERQLEKRRTRMELMELSDEMLKDIGLSRADAYREACRPFWE